MLVEVFSHHFVSALADVSIQGEGHSGSQSNLNVSTEDVRPGSRGSGEAMRERSNTAGSEGSHSMTPSKPNSIKTGSSLGNFWFLACLVLVKEVMIFLLPF